MTLDVEQIVREVLARLSAARPDKAHGATREILATPAGAAKRLVLSERVIALEQLRGRLAGIDSVQVCRGAIITPAARDFLKDNKISLAWQVAPAGGPSARVERSGISAVAGPANIRPALVVGVAETTWDPARALQPLTAAGHSVSRVAQSGLCTVTAEIADAVGKGGQIGLLFTSETAVAMSAANRVRGVRAATGDSPATIAAAVAAVGANLLILDPKARGSWELNRIVGDFVRGAPRTCPPRWQAILSES
ncbi:MAG TPA: hypothetical protein VFE24_14245 [Pirellulales bacterium]|jgi:pyruvate/2-oxoglutarate dehydrogenase complex dihydrolipoamide acyltransferase (E2) component|nr:hypothetical protein [Pirellulales bacterium]